MDTPERSQIGSSLSKFEESPVFNYINSLSPIPPVRFTHNTQTFNSLSFGSPPSVFTSPHVTLHRDSRFLRRHLLSDLSKPDVSFNDGNKADKSQEINDESYLEPQEEPLSLASDFPRTLKYDCGSPDNNPTSNCGIEADSIALADTSTTPVSYHEVLFEGECSQQKICQIDRKKEETGCDWESLYPDATGLINFDSPIEVEGFGGTMHLSQDQGETSSQFHEEDRNDFYIAQLDAPVDPCEQHRTEDHSTLPEETSELKDINHTIFKLANTSMSKGTASDIGDEWDNEPVSNLHRGMRRRCLVFEMGGVRRKNLNDSSSSSSSMLSQSDGKTVSIHKQGVPIEPGASSSRCILPGIGLHLNALASTPKGLKIVKHETLASTFRTPTTGGVSVNKLVILASSERNTEPNVNDIQVEEDASEPFTDMAIEDFNHDSPKKKRRKPEHSGENEACKRCNCKKSKCLKLYCECFAAGVYCIEPCSCQECFNKPIHEDTVLATRKQIESRNPLAFAPKVIRSSDSIPETVDESNQTPASSRHKRGCNCKKSSCLKKYCECFQGGVGCSINCRCEGCKNAFGRKDGFPLLETEAGPDAAETEKYEENMADKGLQKLIIHNTDEENADSTLPAIPLHLSRLSVQLPFSPKSKLQRSLTLGSTSALQSCQRQVVSDFLHHPDSKNEKKIPTIQDEDEIPEILRGHKTPISAIKNASPNSKRVSPPHCDYESSSPGRRSCRKLVLQSIPSFPSLTRQP